MAQAVDAILTINFINKLFPFFGVVFSTRNIEHVLHVYTYMYIARRASVPVRSEQKSGHAKKFFAFGPREKWDESKKVEGRDWGRGKKVMLARKPPDFEKPVRPRTGLLIGAAWSS